jgi:hypothetical protein
MKTVFVLKTKINERALPWSEPAYFKTRKERDRAAAENRILGGILTHSYEEKKTEQEIESINFE